MSVKLSGRWTVTSLTPRLTTIFSSPPRFEEQSKSWTSSLWSFRYTHFGRTLVISVCSATEAATIQGNPELLDQFMRAWDGELLGTLAPTDRLQPPHLPMRALSPGVALSPRQPPPRQTVVPAVTKPEQISEPPQPPRSSGVMLCGLAAAPLVSPEQRTRMWQNKARASQLLRDKQQRRLSAGECGTTDRDSAPSPAQTQWDTSWVLAAAAAAPAAVAGRSAAAESGSDLQPPVQKMTVHEAQKAAAEVAAAAVPAPPSAMKTDAVAAAAAAAGTRSRFQYNKEQQRAIVRARGKANIFLTGVAGTGES